MQHIAHFNRHCEETGVIEDSNFINHENPPPVDVNLSDPIQKATWITLTFYLLQPPTWCF
jgi:hypothetical protein